MTNPLKPIERRLLSYDQMATYLSISKRAVYHLIDDNPGAFPKIQIRTRVLFDCADVDAWIEQAKLAARAAS